jgi:RNA polymerase sigma factor (sigma-70 family)
MYKEQKLVVEIDKELIDGIKSGNRIVLEEIYKKFFPIIKNLVCKNSGSQEEAKDIFQETMIIVYEKIKSNPEPLQCSLKTFFYSIAKRLWLKKLNGKGFNNISINDAEDTFEVAEDLKDAFEKDEEIKKMNFALGFLGEPCKSLIEDFYLNEMSLVEITEKFGYSNSDTAKTQKYKCLMRLRRFYFSETK